MDRGAGPPTPTHKHESHRVLLGLDEGRFRCFPEDRGSDLPTGIAVDAGRVYEEIARDVFQHSFLGVSHVRVSLLIFIHSTPGSLKTEAVVPWWTYPTAALTKSSSFWSSPLATAATSAFPNWPSNEDGLSYSTQVFSSSFP